MKLYYGARPVQRVMKAGVQVRPELVLPQPDPQQQPESTTWEPTEEQLREEKIKERDISFNL